MDEPTKGCFPSSLLSPRLWDPLRVYWGGRTPYQVYLMSKKVVTRGGGVSLHLCFDDQWVISSGAQLLRSQQAITGHPLSWVIL